MRPLNSPARQVLVAIALASLAAVAFALFTQYNWDMQPCPWCILQRVLFLLIALLAGLAALAGSRTLAIPASLLILTAAGSGVASAWYQHFVAARSSSCNLTLADRIVTGLKLDTLAPAAFEVRASCAEAAANLAGLPYEFWSLALFAVLGAAALWCAWRARG